MKFLLMFFIFMVLLWQWRRAREDKVRKTTRQNQASAGVVDMVACAHCGLHLPASDAVRSASAVYCSSAHRQAREP